MDKIHFCSTTKNGQPSFRRSYLYGKTLKIMVTPHIHSSSQIGYMLENFEIIWICTLFREKKEVERSRMIQNTKLLRIWLFNWKTANPNGCIVVINNLHSIFIQIHWILLSLGVCVTNITKKTCMTKMLTCFRIIQNILT